MMKISFFFCILFIVVALSEDGFGPHRFGRSQPPTNIHLYSYQEGYVVTWQTREETPKSILQLGRYPDSLNEQYEGDQITFQDGGSLKTNRTIHHATSNYIQQDTRYYYRVGDPDYGFSTVYSFRTKSLMPSKFAVFGDFGDVNAVSLGHLQNLTLQNEIDAVIHVGDFAYDLDTDQGLIGDEFLQSISTISANVPYYVAPGNHESAYNFTHFTNRFYGANYLGKYSGSDTNWWYSFDIVSSGANVHFISLSSEVYYYYDDYDLIPSIQRQYNWLINDLESFNAQYADWIIVYLHRPFYCSQLYEHDCSKDPETLRNGIPDPNNPSNLLYGLEPIYNKYGIDLSLEAHLHAYERFFPVTNNGEDYQVFPDTQPAIYQDPKYPVHIVSGSAGCQEGHDFFIPLLHKKFSAKRSDTFGFGELQVMNKTHLHWTQYIAEGDVNRNDELYIVKSSNNINNNKRSFK
eukprot:TRINITY_DN70_c3_g1_i1.p1 TRINITY_DN70_c3_g1~~TRINITY_DN70_c3_g1_i1.p1  ORF type:complete len:479 (-),score=131.96 TRINITY_DN70_c3_g1_i1:59-1444(-)